MSLGGIHQESEQVIPILIGYLIDGKEQALRYGALWSLRQFGPAAKPAVPNLLKLINDVNASVRSEATNALIAIDPEAAAKAGVQ
jgi:HEAT repeat protein